MEAVLALSTKKKAKNLSRRIKCKVASVQTSEALIKQLEQGEPEVILLDISMPSLSGEQLVEILKKNAGDVDVPLILVSNLEEFDVDKLSSVLGYQGDATSKTKRQIQPIPAQLRPDLHNPKSGRIDAGQVATFFGLSQSKLAKILGRSPQTVNKTPDSARLQNKLGIFLRIATALVELFGSAEKARIWLNAPHPEFDNTRPMKLIERRKFEIVADLLEDALLGHPG